MSIDAMKQALAALEGWANHGDWVWPESALEQAKRNTIESITALRTAIEQGQGLAEKVPAKGTLLEQTLRKVWDEMPHTAMMDAIIGGTGVMLGDKRIDPASIYKQPEQEPVAWVNPKWLNPKTRHWTNDTILHKPIAGWVPLYTAPRQWQGLTEAEKVNVAIDCGCADVAWMDFADAIEAKLWEKNT